MFLIFLSSFEYLLNPVSSFSISRGNAVSGIFNESFQLFVNPSGMGSDFEFSYQRYICSTDLISLSKGFRFQSGNIGAGIIFMNGGEMVRRDTTGESLGVFYDLSSATYFGIKRDFNKVSIGFSTFFPYEKVYEYSTYGAGLNLGVIYRINKNLSSGISVRNIGYILKPLINEKYWFKGEIRTGLSYTDENKYIGLDIMYPFSFSAGFNLKLLNNLSLNFGYNRKSDFNTGTGEDMLNGLIFGLNVKKGSFLINYNIIFSGIFGIRHSFGLKI